MDDFDIGDSGEDDVHMGAGFIHRTGSKRFGAAPSDPPDAGSGELPTRQDEEAYHLSTTLTHSRACT